MKNKLFRIVSDEEQNFEDDLEYYVKQGYVPLYETFRITEYQNKDEITTFFHILLKHDGN